jgi:acyl-CoA thioesterase
MSTITTLGDAMPSEMARVRKVLGQYKELGPVGMFGAMFIEQSLQAADKAVMSGDVVAMLHAFAELKEIN